MKRFGQYLPSFEMQELMWLSSMVQMCERLVENMDPKECKEWIRRIKTARTNLEKVANERIEVLPEVEKVKVGRRAAHTQIKVAAYDDFKVDKSDFHRIYTIDSEDFLDLCDAAFLQCYACPQGDVVKDCSRRALFHRIGLAVHANRTNPAPGECEWRCDNEQRQVTPQYKLLKEEQFLQLP